MGKKKRGQELGQELGQKLGRDARINIKLTHAEELALYREIKAIAAEKGVFLREEVLDAMRQHVAAHHSR